MIPADARRRLPILIVGGGIAGLATARALALSGRRVIVCEQARAFAEIGAGIQLGPNGLRALDRLGLLAAVEPFLVRPDELVVMDGLTAQEVTCIPVTKSFNERFGYPYALVHRADLHRLLLESCAVDPLIELRTATRITEQDDMADHVVATTGDGDRITADLLIGADGLWSTIRSVVIADGAPTVSGHIAYRAVLPVEAIEPQYRRNAMMLWAGPRNHLVHYPLRGGALFNLVAVFHSNRYVEGWDRQGDPEELTLRFADNCETVRALLAKVETWRMWVLCDREPARNWSKGRIALVGDAAHPMLQYLAQGAGMALEDAVVVARMLSVHSEPEAALVAYSGERYRRTGRCQLMARVYGGFYHASGVARELRNEFLEARSAHDGRESLAWLYDHEPGPLSAPKPGLG